MSFEEVSPVPGAADTGSVSERSAQRAAIATPRTSRQWNVGSEEPPADVTRLRGASGEDDVVRCGTGWWIVAPGEDPVVPDSFADGFRWRAGASIPPRLWPLSEVLPETPEPPQDWQPKPGERVIGKLFSHPDDDIEGEFVGHRGDFVSNLNVGTALWCAVLRATLRPAASQSVPAVPEASTGGADSGEAAGAATEELSVRWYPVVDDTIGGWAISNVDLPVSQLDTRNGKHFTVGNFLSEEIARHLCDLHNAALLPDSETERLEAIRDVVADWEAEEAGRFRTPGDVIDAINAIVSGVTS